MSPPELTHVRLFFTCTAITAQHPKLMYVIVLAGIVGTPNLGTPHLGALKPGTPKSGAPRLETPKTPQNPPQTNKKNTTTKEGLCCCQNLKRTLSRQNTCRGNQAANLALGFQTAKLNVSSPPMRARSNATISCLDFSNETNTAISCLFIGIALPMTCTETFGGNWR